MREGFSLANPSAFDFLTDSFYQNRLDPVPFGRRGILKLNQDIWAFNMNGENEELMHQLGSFEPVDGKRMATLLEERGIPFEVESNHSALLKPGRWLEQYLAMSPEGSKLEIFVPESRIEEASQLYREIFDYVVETEEESE